MKVRLDRRVTALPLILTSLAFLSPSLPARAHADITQGSVSQLSLSTSNGAPSGTSTHPSASPNSRYLAFESTAEDLVTDDSNKNTDIFLRDTSSSRDSTALVSINTAGQQGNGDSINPSVSPVLPDGFYAVAFESDSQNLGSLDNLSVFPNIYVRFPTLSITEIVSPGQGYSFPGGSSTNPSITVVQKGAAHQVLVTFVSDAGNLVANDTNNVADIFLATFNAPTSTTYDPTQLVTLKRVSVGPGGQQSSGRPQSPKISADGRYIVYASTATDIVSGVTGTFKQIYRYDIATEQTILISKTSAGVAGNGDSTAPVISYNGRYVAYLSEAANILPSVPQPPGAVWYDTLNNTMKQINATSAGVSGDDEVQRVTLSANGRFAGFADISTNLSSTTDSNGREDLFVKDLENGDLAKLSNGPNGAQANGSSLDSTFSASTFNGVSYLVNFQSTATNLTGASTTLGGGDIFNNSVSFELPALARGTRLEVPPDVALLTKKIQLSTEQFAAVVASPATVGIARPRATGTKIQYVFEIKRTVRSKGKNRTTRITKTGKRNAITIAKSKGTYAVRNRVIAVNRATGRTTFKTPFSPRQRFTIS